MICGFKQKFPWGEPTYFREKILAGVGMINIHSKAVTSVGVIEDNMPLTGKSKYIPKIHTMREGNRWKAGDKIHMAYGVRTKNYQCFNKDIPELDTVNSVQDIGIFWTKKGSRHIGKSVSVHIDNELYCVVSFNDKDQMIHGLDEGAYIKTLAINDGFNSLEDFLRWFNKDFEGQILHWTKLTY